MEKLELKVLPEANLREPMKPNQLLMDILKPDVAWVKVNQL